MRPPSAYPHRRHTDAHGQREPHAPGQNTDEHDPSTTSQNAEEALQQQPHGAAVRNKVPFTATDFKRRQLGERGGHRRDVLVANMAFALPRTNTHTHHSSVSASCREAGKQCLRERQAGRVPTRGRSDWSCVAAELPPHRARTRSGPTYNHTRAQVVSKSVGIHRLCFTTHHPSHTQHNGRQRGYQDRSRVCR